jgi:hypothetical protein
VAPDNPFLVAQQLGSNLVEAALDIWQELRDSSSERLFMAIYGSPLVRDWAGLNANKGSPRPHPGVTPEHHNFMEQRKRELRSQMTVGGVREAALRMLLYVGAQGGADERSFAMIRKMRAEKDRDQTLAEFKDVVREQALMMMMDGPAAIQAMDDLLAHASAADIREACSAMKQVLEVASPLNERGLAALERMEAIFEAAAQRAEADVPANAGAAPQRAARKTSARRNPVRKATTPRKSGGT